MGFHDAASSLVPPGERETAVVVAVEVPALVEVYRDEFPAFHALGIPLHVTLLYPFVPPEALAQALPRLAAVVARHERFAFALTELRTFPRTVWLAPDPAAPFRTLTRAIEAAFPQTPHWGGAFDEVIPHVTLADGVEEHALAEILARLRPCVEPLLPVAVAAEEVTVLCEQEDGRAAVEARLPLG